ncbi:MAG: hypothetical protein E6G32_13645 [Actinobacteria bacterium]|nr:MAG: hypothetical protein E6G32_13645 [Actinomycetota bacterium]
MAGRKVWAFAAVVLLLAGCGGGGGGGRLSKAEYQRKMQAEAQRLTTDAVDALNPPEDADADTQRIADTLHRFAAIVGQIEDAAAKGNLASVRRFVAQLQNEGRAAQPAVQDLKQKGYDVGQFSG